MDIIPAHAFLQHRNTFSLHLEDNLVDLAGLWRESATQRNDTSDIGTVGLIFATSIDEDIVLPLASGRVDKVNVVSDVVEGGTALTAGDDRGGGLLTASIGNASTDNCGLDLALVGCGLGGLNGGNVCLGRDIVRLSQESNLVGILDDTSVLNGRLQGGNVDFREAFESGFP